MQSNTTGRKYQTRLQDAASHGASAAKSSSGESHISKPSANQPRSESGSSAPSAGSTAESGEVERANHGPADTRLPSVPEEGNGGSENQAAALFGSEDAPRSTADSRVRARSDDSVENREQGALAEAWEAVTQAKENIKLLEKQLMQRYGHLIGNGSEDPEPPSKGKDKDLREWGKLGIPEKELEVEQQRARFDELRNSAAVRSTESNRTPSVVDNDETSLEEEIKIQAHKLRALKALRKSKNEKTNIAPRRFTTPMSLDMENLIDQTVGGRRQSEITTSTRDRKDERQALKASSQLDPDSFLGKLLKPEHKKKKFDSSDDESSDGDSSDSDSSDSEPSDSSEDEGRKRKKRKARYKPIAPTPPAKYSGEADVIKFYRYVSQCERYWRDARIPKRDIIPKLADSLEGRALQYYSTVIAMDLPTGRWTPKRFYTEIFDHCFPADFRIKQHARLDGMKQNNKLVKEYAADLMIVYRIVGYSSERERVFKLWNGLRPELQRALWKENLDPQTSTWEEVVRVAERHEIADRIVEAGDRKPSSGSGGSKHANNSSHNHNGNSQNKYNSHNKSSDKKASSSSDKPKDKKSKHQLSEKEMSELRAEGKCFNCKETGHISRNCPHKHTVKASGSSSKPPGAKSFNIEVAVAEEERLSQLASTTEGAAEASFVTFDSAAIDLECLEGGSELYLGNIGLDCDLAFDLFEEDTRPEIKPEPVKDELDEMVKQVYNPGDIPWANGEIGNPYAKCAEYLLESMRPYPGDPSWESKVLDRFTVYPCSEDSLAILDSVTGESEELPIERLTRSDFLVGRWYAIKCTQRTQVRVRPLPRWHKRGPKVKDPWAHNAEWILEAGLSKFAYKKMNSFEQYCKLTRFKIVWDSDVGAYQILDHNLHIATEISEELLTNPYLDIRQWYFGKLKRMVKQADNTLRAALFEYDLPQFFGVCVEDSESSEGSVEDDDPDGFLDYMIDVYTSESDSDDEDYLGLYAQAVEEDTVLPAVQRNAAVTKDLSRIVPNPIVVVVNIDGRPARALIDTGSLCDFMSSTLADQLKLNKKELATPLPVQLAVQGSRSKINYNVECQLQYQNVNEKRTFDIINVSSYDLILGTPFLYQHSVMVGFNPTRVVIGSDKALPIKGAAVRKLASRSAQLREENLEEVRTYLRQLAEPLCKSAEETPLPPLRDINHTIDLIDENKIYQWRASRCPQAFMPQWVAKRNAYIKSGRWAVTNARNSVPMIFIPKAGKPGEPIKLRTPIDLRPRNDNTKKMSSPLPDIDGIMIRVASKKYWSLLDLKDAYEQLRIDPKDVWKTTFGTPNGNMVSHVVQIGDCNAPATYQALMNHIFAPYLGKFMDAYLDDIVIYSDTLEEHIEHVKIVLGVLEREKLYLSAGKLNFLCGKVKLLGRIVDENGIQMDPNKVDALVKWKTPTNRELLRGFLGAAGYLADDIDRVRIPMGVLHTLTSDSVPFRWGPTQQRAFDEIKDLAVKCKDHHRRPIKYGDNVPPINMVTDGCATGIAGVVSQGEDWQTALVAAFYSAKLSPAQQNYAVHEIEMLAGVETMLRYKDLLLGVHFRWFTDHKGLIHLMNQRNLSGRQARWMEKIAMFDFEIIYVPGTQNILSDALSRIYSNDAPGTVRAPSEYTEHDDTSPPMEAALNMVTAPVLVGTEGESASFAVNFVGRRNKRAQEQPAETGRPETAEEFAARLRDDFVLRGPRERTEGEGRKGKKKDKNPPSKNPERLVIRIPARQQNNDGELELSDKAGSSKISDTSKNGQTADLESSVDTEQALEENSASVPPLDLAKEFDGIDVVEEIRHKYGTDTVFKKIIEKPSDFGNFQVENGIVYLKDNGRKLLCIPEVKVNGRSIREIIIAEGHSLLAHLGTQKTYDYLRDYVWWKSMHSDIHSYCESCMTCKRSKPSNQKPYGLLNPLDVPSQPWEAIGIDFVGPLPESRDRDGVYDSISVIIDLMTGMVHLVPSRTDYSAKNVAEMVFAEVYKLHGLPSAIISDRDVLFTSAFWEELHKLIGTKLRMSSAYHPESDGSTERANRTVTQMLRNCIDPNQKDWVQRLPAIEFAINSARSESTGFAPFFLNSGRMPRSFIWNSNEPSKYPGVKAFAQRMKTAIMKAHDSIIAARVKQTRTANRKRQKAPFETGDFVYISTKNISLPPGLARKLAPKFIGPYLITEDFKNNSYRIKLPSSLKARGVHDVFHASLLRIHVPNDDRLFPGRLDTQVFDSEDREVEWAVNKITNHAGAGKDSVFEILWKSGDKSWLPYDKINHLDALKEYFDAMGVKNIQELSIGYGKPPKEDPQVFLGHMALDLATEYEAINISERETVFVPRHLLSRARKNPTLLFCLIDFYLMSSAPLTNEASASDDHPPSTRNNSTSSNSHVTEPKADHAYHNSGSETPYHPFAPISFWNYPLILPPAHHPSTRVFVKDDLVYVVGPDGQATYVTTISQAKLYMAFHSRVARKKFQTGDKRDADVVEPFGYRHFAELVNADPAFEDKMVYFEGHAIQYPRYKNNHYYSHPLKFEMESKKDIEKALQIAKLFDFSLEQAQAAKLTVAGVAFNAYGKQFKQDHTSGGRTSKKFFKHKGKGREHPKKDKDGDLIMG